MNEACRSGGRAASWNSIVRPTITNPVVASRPALKPASRRFARRASATVPAGPCPPASRRLGDQLEENASDLQRVGPAAAQQDAEAKSEGEAARRSPRSFHFERCLGHGLRP